ncbi:MAG: XRE family transcriptional regulator [Prevotella sp.]|nr:XRE family transcriptional regulator [Prevotella sp.]MDD3386994.1 XRE family transcriptional regulator [Prevotella sp.]
MQEETSLQIGCRLKGLRDALDISVEDMAQLCGITADEYLHMEEGTGSGYLHVSNLQKIARKYGISIDELLFGEEPHMNTYFITRKGKGQVVERRKEYKYQSLASGFSGRKADPFMVVIDPKPEEKPISMSSHANQEFDMVMEGCLEITIGTKVLTLNEGDSIYFDSTQPHHLRALENKPVTMLAIIF